MKRTVYYYALPSQPALDRFPVLDVLGIAYNVVRWLGANRERGYMGIGNCNALAEHFFWHYPCEFCFQSGGF